MNMERIRREAKSSASSVNEKYVNASITKERWRHELCCPGRCLIADGTSGGNVDLFETMPWVRVPDLHQSILAPGRGPCEVCHCKDWCIWVTSSFMVRSLRTCGSLANFENLQLSRWDRVAHGSHFPSTYLIVASLHSNELLHAKFNLGNDVKHEMWVIKLQGSAGKWGLV